MRLPQAKSKLKSKTCFKAHWRVWVGFWQGVLKKFERQFDGTGAVWRGFRGWGGRP
jgi:hypothetical protein